MIRGRKPVPTTLAKLHGNPSKTKPNQHEPKPQGDLTEPPDWLTDSQQEAFRYALQHAPPGLLKMIDRSMLAAWAVHEDLFRQAVEAQAQTTLLVKTSKENPTPMQSPYLPVINKQSALMRAAASELGFSPVSRPRIGQQNAMLPGTPLDLPDDKEAKRQPPTLREYLASKPAIH